MLRFSAQSATRLPGRVFGGIFRANSNLVKKQRCRYFSQKSPSVPVPLRSRKTVAADSQSPFARPVLIPAENSQSSQEMISKDVESKLASTKTLDQLHWIPPAGKPKTSAEVELESWQKLPPPPDRAFNSFVPTDRLAEQEYIKQVGKALPPDDIFQIPVKLSQPWFGKLLKFYCAGTLISGVSTTGLRSYSM